MSFLAPLMLLGGLAVAVPIVLHFFYKARYRPVPWAAMDFLRQAIAAGGRGESIDAVFVFDTSYSMGARDGDKTRLDRAKDAALRVIDDLPPNSTVQVYTCSDRVAQVPFTPGNLDQARQVVQNVQLTSLSGDLLPGLTEAYAALDRGAGANKEVYLFTDLQKAGWDRQAGATRAKAAEIRQRATLVVVRCGNPDRAVNNVAIADLTYPGGIPHTGNRLPVTVLLKNTGKTALRKLTVTLEVDGKLQEKESAEVDEITPGQTYPVTLLTPKLTEAGNRLVTARVTSDDLPGDNRLDRLIPVRDVVRVLVVDGAPDDRDPKESAGHFVRNALLPVPADQLDEYFVRVTVEPAERAGPGLLGVTDVVFLCNVPTSSSDRPGVPGLSPEFVDRLTRFVRDGGSLVIGVGDNLVPARYNAVLGPGGVDLLPYDLGPTVTAPVEQPFKPAPDSTEVPSFLAKFREEPFKTVTADTDVFKVVGAKADRPGGRVLMRLADGTPWLARRTVGDGEVIFVGTSLDATWTNWPAKAGSYLSFVQLTLSHLTGKAGRGVNRVAGEPIVWNPPEATTGFDLLRPDQTRVNLGKAQGGDGGSKLTVTAADTSLAGVYRVVSERDSVLDGPRFAVAPDLRESDNLDSLSDPEAEEVLGFRPVMVLAGAEETLTAERSKREWTVWVLLAMFVVAVGEAGWAWLCGKAW